MTPMFPIITFYNNAVEIIPDETHLTKATVLGVLEGKNRSLAYDISGDKWNYELTSTQVKDTFVTRLLAKTLYNPFVKVQPIWSKMDKYELQELKMILFEYVDKDEDILKQFVRPDKLKQIIKSSTLFNEIYNALKKLCLKWI
jgi:hypothetical protein